MADQWDRLADQQERATDLWKKDPEADHVSGDKPLSNAERQRRYRAHKRQLSSNHPKPPAEAPG